MWMVNSDRPELKFQILFGHKISHFFDLMILGNCLLLFISSIRWSKL